MYDNISSMLDKIANKLESMGLIKEALDLDKVSDLLDKSAGSGMHLLGSGQNISITGETKITQREKSAYRNAIGNQNYYDSLSKITDIVIGALEKAGLTPIIGEETWVGTFTGALSEGETAKLNIELVKDGQKVKNSQLVLNIYKMDGVNKTTYELNTYLA